MREAPIQRLSYRRAELLAEALRQDDGEPWTVSLQVFYDGVHPQVSDGVHRIVEWWPRDGYEEYLYCMPYEPMVFKVEPGLVGADR